MKVIIGIGIGWVLASVALGVVLAFGARVTAARDRARERRRIAQAMLEAARYMGPHFKAADRPLKDALLQMQIEHVALSRRGLKVPA